MIRFDGYYLFEPKPYQERKEHNPWYFASAYLFLTNGKLLIASNYFRNKKNVLFNIEDFKIENEYNYFINNDVLFYINKYDKNGYRFYHKIISSEKIVYQDTGDKIKFVPWSKNKKRK